MNSTKNYRNNASTAPSPKRMCANLLANAKLDGNGLFHFMPKRVPRNIDALRFMSSRSNKYPRLLHVCQYTAIRIVAIWRSMGSGFSLELNEDRVVKGLQKLHDKYYSTNKSLYNQRLSLNTKAVKRLNTMLSDIFLPFPQGMERKLKPRSAKALVLPNLNIKATSLKVPAFTDLYDGTKTVSEWSGATVTPDLESAFEDGVSLQLHALSSCPYSTVAEESEDIEEYNSTEEDEELTERIVYSRDPAVETRNCFHNQKLPLEADETHSRDISTQTNLIIPSDVFIPEERNVRVRFVFEDDF